MDHFAAQAVRQLNEAVAALPEGACDDLLVLPIYSALPLEMQVPASEAHSHANTVVCFGPHALSVWSVRTMQVPRASARMRLVGRGISTKLMRGRHRHADCVITVPPSLQHSAEPPA